ncbi:hypothetical protein ABIE65_005035 [Constrictibacter sp. MBR-5]|uniref:hypothetical protein n=1 Tax=Constrictibacter sp. MBR-5 TaxID=3156467 RepID=UPI0033996E92
MSREPVARRWSDHAAAILAPALGEDAPLVAADVAAGRAFLWEHPGAGYVVTRWDRAAGGRELVIVAGAGCDLAGCVPHWQAHGRLYGAVAVRAHATRPGIARMLGGLGFVPVETVCRWKVE